MPKESEIKKSISAFYKKSAIDLCMYAFVKGIMCVLPSVTIRDGINIFLKNFNIDESDYPIDAAVKNFNRINNDFIWRDSK